MMNKTSKLYATGGKTGDKLKMVKDPDTGKQVPFFTVDENGVQKKGGGSMPSTKGYFKGGKTKGYTKGGKTTLSAPKSGEELLSRGTPSGLGPQIQVDVGRGRGRRGGRGRK